jgi:hypothetical protein
MPAAERSLTDRAIAGALWMSSGKLAYALMLTDSLMQRASPSTVPMQPRVIPGIYLG